MADAALPIPVRPQLPAGVTGGMAQLRALSRQPAVARAMPLIGVLGALLAAWMAYANFVQPTQHTLFSNLADGDKAAVADSLKAAGVKYRVDRDTGAITVSDADYYQAKMLLAQAGLPKSAPDGNAMISSLPMGASRAVEGERLRSANEMDLARTIEAIDAVETARVHLAVEQPSVFLRDRSPAAASVMLRMRAGRTLGEGQVQAIVNLVASSVPGLAPENVSVVDQSGRLLSHQGGADGATDRQVELQQRIEQRYQDAIAKLLTPLVGADGFTSEVHADLDFAEVQATRETYPKDTAVVRQEQGGWNSDGAKQEAGGIPGAISNQAPPAAQVSAQPDQKLAVAAPGAIPTTQAGEKAKTSETYNRTYDLGHEVSVTKQPVGGVKRLTVAVALKEGAKPRGIAEMNQLQDLLKGAVGFDQQRGDTLAVTSRQFIAPEPAVSAKWYEASWVNLAARNISALLIAALIVFGVAKPLMKRRAAVVAEQAAAAPARAEIGGQIAAALAKEARADPSQPVTLDMIEAAPGYADRAALIRNFVRQDPDRAALVVRDLIRADMPGGAG